MALPLGLSGKLGASILAASTLIICLTIVTYSVTRISATEYLGSVEVENTSMFKVSVTEAYATIKDEYGVEVASFDVSGLPISLEPDEKATIEIPVRLSSSIEEIASGYSDTSPFFIHGRISYTVGIVKSVAEVSFSLTKTEIAAYSGLLP